MHSRVCSVLKKKPPCVEAEATACESPRSCAKSYPVKEEAGVLWVWPTAGADAWLEASTVPVATAAAEFGELPGDWGMVELPVGRGPVVLPDSSGLLIRMN